MPEVEILGVHPIPDVKGHFGQSVGLVVLVEAVIRDRDASLDLGRFGQSREGTLGPNSQVAYDEAFLSEDGMTVVGHDLRSIDSNDIRVAFFLHFYDPTHPILTSYGPVNAPEPTPLPERLARIVQYDPVD